MDSSQKFTWEEHLAIFGGSFDPPHLGHVEAIQNLFRSPGVECVMIVPSASTPLKNTHTSFENRFAMSKLLAECLAKYPIEMSGVERDQKIQYTWQLLKHLAQDAEQPLAFVMGSDQFLNLENWANYPEVLSLSDWIVLLRKPTTFEQLSPFISNCCAQGWLQPEHSGPAGRRYKIKLEGKTRMMEFVDTPAQNITSTEIRKNFALGKSEDVKSLLPTTLFNFIERNHIYGGTRNDSH